MTIPPPEKFAAQLDRDTGDALSEAHPDNIGLLVGRITGRDRAVAQAVIDELRQYGCPHACSPPCPVSPTH